VHLFGLAADMDPIVELAAARGLVVLEDAAQAIGAKYKNRFVGTIGEFGCFSFFPSKNLGGAGDGGLITTRDAELAEKIRILRMHGSKQKYHHDVLGTNSRLDALQAAVLRVKLRHLEKWTAGRQGRAARYRELFAVARVFEFVTLPSAPSTEYAHVFNQFTIRAWRRDELREYLRMKGIPSDVYYPIPLHLQPAFAGLGHRAGEFPHSGAASAEVISLPVYPELGDEKQDLIVAAVKEFYLACG
jgi:dTDP-4-amino-4,6-dideoxygalactose transaminase